MSNVITGTLVNAETAAMIREATAEETVASIEAAKRDGGAGIILVDGIRCYVEGGEVTDSSSGGPPQGGSKITSLADARRATPGQCAICGRSAASWHRTGLAADGLVLAARACEAHESDVVQGLHQLTTQDVVALIPRARRRARALSARRRADRLDGVSRGHARADASLRGASSACHAHALLSGASSREARALRALADALDTSA